MLASRESVSTEKTGAGKGIRVFLAIPLQLSRQAQTGFKKIPEQLSDKGCKGKWVALKQLHFTLAFLGNREPAEITQAVVAGKAVARQFSPFNLIGDKIASFRRRPRLLFLNWLSDPEDSFSVLANSLRNQLAEKMQVPNDFFTRQPHPHTTLVRFRSSREKAFLQGLSPEPADDGKKIWLWPQLPHPDFTWINRCDRFILYQSHLTPAGASHEELQLFYLRS